MQGICISILTYICGSITCGREAQSWCGRSGRSWSCTDLSGPWGSNPPPKLSNKTLYFYLDVFSEDWRDSEENMTSSDTTFHAENMYFHEQIFITWAQGAQSWWGRSGRSWGCTELEWWWHSCYIFRLQNCPLNDGFVPPIDDPLIRRAKLCIGMMMLYRAMLTLPESLWRFTPIWL